MKNKVAGIDDTNESYVY